MDSQADPSIAEILKFKCYFFTSLTAFQLMNTLILFQPLLEECLSNFLHEKKYFLTNWLLTMKPERLIKLRMKNP